MNIVRDFQPLYVLFSVTRKSLFELEAFLALQKIFGLFIHKQNGISNEHVQYTLFYYKIVIVNRILFFTIIITIHKEKMYVISVLSRTALSFDSALSGKRNQLWKNANSFAISQKLTKLLYKKSIWYGVTVG